VACAGMIFGSAGLAIDIGRLYITKNEAQSFADSAALFGALEIDGTADGLTRAESAVSASVLKWNFGTTSFSGTTVEFSANGTSGWNGKSSYSSTSAAKSVQYIRVTPTVNNVRLLFLPYIGTPTTSTVIARAVAGQILVNAWPAGGSGVFPFSPISHVYGNTAADVHANDVLNRASYPGTTVDNFGFTVGQQYTLRWPSNPNTNNFNNVCAGDATAQWVSKADGSSNSQRGYIQLQSAAAIKDAIISDHLDYAIHLDTLLNDNVDPTNGAKSAERDALATRIGQDTDTTSTDYAHYTGNGRRLVNVIIQSGYRDASGNLLNATTQAAHGVGYAQFLLLPASEYDQAGNKPWCAVYVGNAPIENANNTGGGNTSGQGISYVRLSQ
jgi:hypothetical protein